MRNLKKFMTILLAAGLACALFSTAAQAAWASGGSSDDSGTCGRSVTWVLEDGVLTISGEGEMYDYDNYSHYSPWYAYGYSITAVVIEDGLTYIGDSAFYNCSSLTSVTIPDSVTSIGYGAFYNCTGLTDVYYGGSETEWNAITIGSSNALLLSATIHYNSTGSDSTGDTGNAGDTGDTGDAGDTGDTGSTGDTGDTDTSGGSGDSSGGTDATTPGDLNGDGEVDASDLTILARHVGKVEYITDETALANADVTGDGDVDASDLTKLAQYVGKIISSLD